MLAREQPLFLNDKQPLCLADNSSPVMKGDEPKRCPEPGKVFGCPPRFMCTLSTSIGINVCCRSTPIKFANSDNLNF